VTFWTINAFGRVNPHQQLCENGGFQKMDKTNVLIHLRG